jgi:hypothetical protein
MNRTCGVIKWQQFQTVISSGNNKTLNEIPPCTDALQILL